MKTTRLAAFFGLTGVLLGAFGAHALKAHLEPEMMQIYQTGVLYQFIHALALLFVGRTSAPVKPGPIWPAYLFTVGIILFSGSLYLLSLTGLRWLGAITPLGGICFVAGWVTLLVKYEF